MCPSIGPIINYSRSIVVNHLRRQRTELEDSNHDKIGIAIIYLKYNDPEQTLKNLLASLLKQLIEEQDAVPDTLQALYERHCDHKTSLSAEGVAIALKAMIKTYSKTLIVVDGLDECSEENRWGLVEQLTQLHETVHIIITSRYLDSIREELKDFEQLEVKSHRSDIELFIDRQIRKNRNLRRVVQRNPRMRDDIKNGVVRTTENMYWLPEGRFIVSVLTYMCL